MFVALRDINFAKGRFLLIASVVTLITLLVGFLTGLTAGLGNQNISSVLSINADRVVFSVPEEGEKLDWASSKVTPEMLKKWRSNDQVESAEPLAIQRAKISASKDAPVVIFGLDASSSTIGEAPSGNGMVRLSHNAATELNAKSGDMVTIGKKKYTVEQVGEESWYEHAPVVKMTVTDLKVYSESIGQDDTFANLLLVKEKSSSADFTSLEEDSNTVSKTKLASFTALSTFKSEIGSLGLMIAMLFGISALVIGAFFTVWAIQRKPDVAVLKALGVSTRALVLDSLMQAFIVLFLGITAGTLLTMGLGTLAGSALPFILSPLTLLVPAGLMLVTGLAGSALALRSVVKADPLTALNASR